METTTKNFSSSSSQQTDNMGQRSSLSRLAFSTLFLKYSAMFWFAAILIGQWLFFYYIMAFYGYSVISDNMQIWNRWEPMGTTPYEEGDTLGNWAFAAHAVGAGIVAFGGALQLIPKVRTLAPRFHRINGYVYLLIVLCLALSGFYLSWVRDKSPDLLSAIGTSINGVCILVFAYFTVVTARARNIKDHRKWAIRLFLVSNAQWLLRVGVFSYLITGTVVGASPSFGDPFFPLWTFGCFVIPLATAQLYFYATERRSVVLKCIAGVTLISLTVLMCVGVAGLTPFLMQLLGDAPISF